MGGLFVSVNGISYRVRITSDPRFQHDALIDQDHLEIILGTRDGEWAMLRRLCAAVTSLSPRADCPSAASAAVQMEADPRSTLLQRVRPNRLPIPESRPFADERPLAVRGEAEPVQARPMRLDAD